MKIIELARQAGVRDDEHRFEFSEYKYLERFAALVAAHEREECIKVCMESKVQAMDFTGDTYVGRYFANAIKQKGETT